MNTPGIRNFSSAGGRSHLAWLLLRCVLAGLIAAHGWARFTGGGVVPFGEWLLSQGLPVGMPIAVAVTALEIVGTPLYALGRFVAPLSLLYSTIYFVGIVMVHAREGWFVVGMGRNGVEYSVLLIVCLLCVGVQHVGARESAGPGETLRT
jgi:putative oxidoreductase